MLTKFCRISAPGTGAVKEPLGVDERSPEQGGCLRSEVLVSDLLSSPDPRLGSDLDPVVCHHHGLGVVPAGGVHHGVDREQAGTTTKPILWQLQAGGVHQNPPISSVYLLAGEPLTEMTFLLEELNHQFLLELPDLWLGESSLLVVVKERVGQTQEVVLSLLRAALGFRFSFSLQEEEESEDSDGAVVCVESLDVRDGDGGPGEYLTFLCVILAPATVQPTQRVATARTEPVLAPQVKRSETLQTLRLTPGVGTNHSRHLAEDQLSLLNLTGGHQYSAWKLMFHPISRASLTSPDLIHFYAPL